MRCNRFATSPEFTMHQVEEFAYFLLGGPLSDDWMVPVGIHTVAPAQLLQHEDVHALVVCWRYGGYDDYDGDGVAPHVWFASEADAALRGVSAHDLAWAAVEAIVEFRFLALRLPRAAALQVIIWEIGGWILPLVAHGQLPPARGIRTTLH
jgi:hypothetical protein